MKLKIPYYPDNYKEVSLESVLSHVGAGWHKLVTEMINDLEKLGWEGVLLQIKEKFGGLRFYISGGSPAIFERIDKAEIDSYHTCEKCGEPGVARTGSWIKTLCEKCSDGREPLDD